MTNYREVSVTERLPEVANENYIIVSNKGIKTVRFFNGNRFEAAHYDSVITHWLEEVKDNNDLSDGQHTMRELYDHRITLFIALCKEIYGNPVYQTHNEIWKMPPVDGWFLMGIGKEKGKQITYHLPEGKWNETQFCQVITQSDYEFDGHNSSDVLERLKTIVN